MSEVIAYLHGRQQWNPSQIPGNKLTQLNYAFAKIKNLEIIEDIPNIQKIPEIKKLFPDLSISISIGGWGAEGFSSAVSSFQNRDTFSSNIVNFIRKCQFDGVDIDWEYPGSSISGIKSNKADAENFELFLKLLREKLNSENKKYSLSAAIGADKELIDNLAVNGEYNYAQYLDSINVMTYDLRGSWTHITGHHTNLYPYPNSNDLLSVEQAVDQLLIHHIPSKKIIVGSAAYSRDWYHIKNTNSASAVGEYAGSNGTHTTSYDDLVLLLKKNPNNYHWDQNAQAPYYFDGKIFMSFEDKKSIEHKAKFIREKQLGGIMLWELSLDQNSVLISEAAKILKST
ncbi:glycosyl hydrolase family 18 protein [Enterococcus gilvus]|uniref:glycoside hydrolase family 18 protein n=1 Tax=Enterococcus gilvus TaxID=160453 RepID=UPI0028D50CBF|nr:glycosyl hydrolase family 18 protein [Enterococcus gilvus]